MPAVPLTPSAKLTLACCGLFFLTGLLAGVWKWRAMLSSPNHQAPYYVDTAHRAALLYAFACLVLLRFLEHSPFSEAVNLAAVGLPLLFFAIAIATYLRLGYRGRTANQFERRSFSTTTGVAILAVAEIGGFVVLLVGFALTQLVG